MTIHHPAPAIIVPSSTSLTRCVERMNQAGCGSVLVVRDSHPGELIGIFTERDLLKRLPEIQAQNAWHKPVALVMSPKVTTISVAQIPAAARIMIDGGFRHLPVVDIPQHGPDAGLTRILGVISMRDILRQHALSTTPEASLAPSTRAALCSLLPAFAKSLSQSAHKVMNIDFSFLPLERFLTPQQTLSELVSDFDALIVDIDHRDEPSWLQLLILCARVKPTTRLFLTYDPELHSHRTLAGLEKIAQTGRLNVFPKPINLLAMAAEIAHASPPTAQP